MTTRWLRHREKKWLPLEEAIRKATSGPADHYRLARRGCPVPGYYAGVVVFDPFRMGSPATYQQPELPPVGIQYVIRNDRFIHQSSLPGCPLSPSTA